MSASSRSPTDGRSAASSLPSSAAIRSPERWATSAARSRIAASVAGSIVKPERCGEPDGADHPQRVLLEPCRRVADRAQDARGDIGAPVERVDSAGAGRAVASGLGVAPQAIALTVKSRRARSSSSDVAELDPVRPPEVGVVVVASGTS